MREKYAILLAGWIFSAVCVSGVCQAGVPKDGHGTAAVETTAEDLLPGMSDEMPPAPPADGKGPGPGGQGQEARSADDLKAACVVDKSSKTLQGQKLTTAKADENALLVRNGGSLVLQDAVLQKTGDSTSVDDSNFSGCNAIVLSSNSTIKLRQVELASAAEGANAIFSTGKNSQIVADHVKIHTTAGSSRGLDATYGGTITASDVDIVTEGAHCAALATDRGEGTVTVSRGTLMTFGEGSPCVYSTGAIRAVDSRGIASRSEIAVVEGKNSIELQNVELTGSVKHGVMLYQSFSGDAGTGTASFKATGSRLTNLSTGPMFYVTNTKAQAQLENNQLSSRGTVLVDVTSGQWGRKGANGGDFVLTARAQTLQGAVQANDLSQVRLVLEDGSHWEGSLDAAGTAKQADLSLTAGASWTMTADSHVDSLEDGQRDFANIQSNGHTLYYNAQKSSQLAGKTYALAGGGQLRPEK